MVPLNSDSRDGGAGARPESREPASPGKSDPPGKARGHVKQKKKGKG